MIEKINTEFLRADQGEEPKPSVQELLDYLDILVRVAKRHPTPTVIASIQRTTDKIVERLG